MAASGIFEYGEQLPYVEVSETIALPPVVGFGLQALFFRVRIASIVVTQGPAIGITTAVDPNNRHSVGTTLKQGFTLWSVPIFEAFQSCFACPHSVEHRKCCCDFYLLPVASAREAVSKLLSESATGEIVLTNKDKDELRINCAECRFLAEEEIRDMLKDFADGATWS